MAPGLEFCHALVLNADFRPLSYFPLSIWSWQDTVKAVFLDRVSVISEYDRKIHSPSFEMRLPSVIALKEYVPAARRPAFTRFNVFLRDRFHCQYCGEQLRDQRTHVRPCRAEVARWPYCLGQRRDRLQPLQSPEGQPAAARDRHVTYSARRSNPRRRSCRRTAAAFRPATCTRAGATSCIGTAELDQN